MGITLSNTSGTGNFTLVNNTNSGGFAASISSSSPSIVTSGLVLNLDASNISSYPGSGTTWTDLSGNSNNGTLTNGPTYNSANGGSIIFNGSNNYVSLGNPVSLNVLNFTIGIWIKANSFTNYQNPIFKGDNTQGQYGLIINSSGNWGIQPNSGFITDPISTGIWYYFIGTYDGTNITAYRNAIQKAQYSIAQTNHGSLVTIGADTVNNRYFNGYIGGAQIYNRALSSIEVTQNYNATKTRFGL